MNIEIKHNTAPRLNIIDFACDKPLASKLDKYDLSRFLNKHSANVFCGKPSSGKTTLLTAFFQSKKLLKKVFHNVYIFQPPHSRASMSKNIFSSLPEEKQIDELNEDTLQDVLDRIKAHDSEEVSAIIFDDCTAALQKNKKVIFLLKELINNRRHLHVSIFFVVQTWKALPFEVRRLIENIFLFRCSRETFENIFEELFEELNNKKLFPQLIKLVYQNPHDFLFMNVSQQRLFRNWDEILIEC